MTNVKAEVYFPLTCLICQEKERKSQTMVKQGWKRLLCCFLLLLMLLPVLLGIGIHYAWPKASAGIDKVLAKLAFPLLMVLITVFYIQHHETILKNIGQLGICVR